MLFVDRDEFFYCPPSKEMLLSSRYGKEMQGRMQRGVLVESRVGAGVNTQDESRGQSHRH
jgi:hypothetical protein